MMLILKNKKRGFETSSIVCSSLFSQIKGLMFAPPLKKNHSILIKFKKERNIPIHMMFVFYPIDAVWLDKDYKIVHIARNIKPFISYINPKKQAVAVLETMSSHVNNLIIGDILTANTL